MALEAPAELPRHYHRGRFRSAIADAHPVEPACVPIGPLPRMGVCMVPEVGEYLDQRGYLLAMRLVTG